MELTQKRMEYLFAVNSHRDWTAEDKAVLMEAIANLERFPSQAPFQ